MTSFAAARSFLRSAPAARSAAAKAARSPFRAAAKSPLSHRTFRVPPAQTSFCLESMLPYHTATASALMTSMLSVSQRSYAWLPEDT